MFEFLRRLFGGGGTADGDRDALYVYVRCRSCGEVIRVRINPSTDLAQEFDEGSASDSATGYVLRKEIVGSGTCFRRLHLEMVFDSSRRELSREVQGGDFVTAEEYARYQAERRAAGAQGTDAGAGSGASS
jgi:hypothetical protein